jgi:hypothetical protein
MEQIYLKIKKTLIELTYRYNVQISRKKLKLQKLIISKKKNNKSFLSSDNSNNKSSGLKKNKYKNKFKKEEPNKEIDQKDKKENNIKNNNLINEDKNNDIYNTKKTIEYNSPKIIYSYAEKESINNNAEQSFNKVRKKSINSLFSKDNSYNYNFLFKSSNDLNNNNNLLYMNSMSFSKTLNSKNSDNDEFFKNREINNEIYENENFNIDINKKYIIYPEVTSLNKNYIKEFFEDKNSSNLNDSNNLSSIRKKISSKLLIYNNEKTNRNTFENLCSTKENSFQLNSSYENINKISKYKYIKDSHLQKSIKKFIIDECTKRKSISPVKSNEILRYQKTVIHRPKIKINYEKNSLNNYLTFKLNNSVIDKVHKSSNSLRRLSRDKNEFDYKENSNKNSSPSKKEINIIRASSHKNEAKDKFVNIFSPSTVKRKIIKKKTLIGKKLNAITKNIRNANEAINNPNEFYMNFFNNILQKESFANKEEDGIKTKRTIRYLNSVTAAACKEKNLMTKKTKLETKLNEKIT